MKTPSLKTFTIGLLATTVLYAPHTFAQETDTGASRGFLEEILVTAARRTESVQDIPIAINALDGNMLNEFGINDGDDILKLFPNLSQKQTTSYNSGITIRGVGTNSVHISTQQSVGLYVDDITAVSPFVSQLSLFDLERVEVLRGPQNTLYGRNTTGGAINYISRKPEIGAGPNGYGYAEVGNGGRYGVEGAIGLDLADTVAIRVAGTYESFDGFFTNLENGEDFGGNETKAARAHLLWEPTERLSANLTYSFAERDAYSQPTVHIGNLGPDGQTSTACTTDRTPDMAFGRQDCWVAVSAGVLNASPGLAAQTVGGDVVRENPNSPGNFLVNYTTEDPSEIWNVPGSNINTTTFHNFAANVQYDFDFATLTSITSYLITDIFALNTPDLHSFANPQEGRWKTFSQELRLASADDTRLRWIAGLYYVNETSDQDTWVVRTDVTTPAGIGVSPAVLIDATYKGISAYGQLDYDILENLTLTFGARYTDDKLEGDRFRQVLTNTMDIYDIAEQAPDTRDLSGVTPTNPTQELSEFAYKVGANYNLNSDVLFYVSYSTGFKGGSFDNRALNVDGLTTIEPEFIKALEAGFKSTLFDGALQFNGALFRYKWEDQQRFEVVAGAPALVNVDETRVQGAEFDIRWQVIDDLYIQGGVGFLDSEVIDNTNALALNPSTQGQIGNELGFSPTISANLLLNYSHDIANGRLVFQPSLRYVGEQFMLLSNASNTLQSPQTYVDVFTAFRFGDDEQFEAAFRVENLFKEQAALNTFNAPGANGGYNRGIFRRAFIGSIRMNF